MRDITAKLVDEHRLIKRMLAVLERNTIAMQNGSFRDHLFFLDAVDFIRNYADRYHHAKEEDVLFEALVTNGMPSKNSPVGAMLLEHDHGRAHVRKIEEAAQAALNGLPCQNTTIVYHALAYIELLRGHIDKEDTILYPLAERILPEEMRDGIIAGYEAAETKTPAGFEEHYRLLVERCEQAVPKAA